MNRLPIKPQKPLCVILLITFSEWAWWRKLS